MKRLMAMSILGAAMAMGWATPARADVPSDFGCGSNKISGSDCEAPDGKSGVCVRVEFDSGAPPALSCDTSMDTGGCSVGQIGAEGSAEAAALGLLFAACVAMRRRRA
jgi:hypothetical protein